MTGAPRTHDAGPHGTEERALELFAELAAEFEEGRGDAEAFFTVHPEHAERLRELHRGWLALDGLLRGAQAPASIVAELRDELSHSDAPPALERLAQRDFDARYAVGEELGRGGMGVVHRVVDRVLGRELAMKLVRTSSERASARLLRRFLGEAATIGRLEHPGIVPIHELGLDGEGRVYFTMPLVRGLTLAEILAAAREQRGRWSRARVLEVLLKVCDAVAFAHSRGVLHRDLKPANVMVGRFGEVYVMDWGLARAATGDESHADDPPADLELASREALTLDGEILGTPAYMAPEQAQSNSRELDARCDVYALGAVLYEVLAGERPYGDLASADALAQLRRRAPDPVATLARGAEEELCAITERAMAREREQRYSSVTELAADLRAFLDGRVVRAHRTGSWVEARKWIARNRRLAAALLAAFLFLGAGLATSLVLLRRAERERTNVFRLAQARTLDDLVARAETLYPAHPARIPEMQAWMHDARALVRNLDHDADADDGDDGGGLRGQLARLETRRARWDEDDRWWHGELSKLVTSIEEFAHAEHGLLGSGIGPRGWGVARRLEFAQRERAANSEERSAEAWARAREQVRADPRFAGFELAPQPGLVPLGADPVSGLNEFAHRLSGDVPGRGPDGRLRVTAAGAIVLVLTPASSGGAHASQPFLLSKFEVTQAQWMRAVGHNPSFHRDVAGSDLLPVEQVSWITADRELRRLGLRLPTLKEWAHAHKAGTTSQYFWGDDRSQFVLYANVRDWTMRNRNEPYEPENDGFASIAPIGSFRPNPWGFHDTVGNAFEWCEDLLPIEEGPKTEERDARRFLGGSFQRPLHESDPSKRGAESASYAYRSIGLRPAADLVRE